MFQGSAPLTLAHVAISLAGIVTGFVVIWGLLTSRPLDRWTAWFLATTVATSVTGFLFFPLQPLKPGHALGAISLVILAPTLVARYSKRMAGHWRLVYVIGALTAQYLNFVVLIVQAFLKVPAINALAPTQAEPPFAIAQLVALTVFAVLGVASAVRFHPAANPTA